MAKSRPEARTQWNTRWGRRQRTDFVWYTSEPPRELRRLLDESPLPPGNALDVGCGSGTVTAFLAERFGAAVGLDIALAAVKQARELAPERGNRASFLVGDARVLPFKSAEFSLVFDRGCMHNLPREAYPVYLREVERVLKPGGVFELYFSGSAACPAPPLLSLKGIRRRILGFLGRRKPRRLTLPILERLLPASMEAVTLEPTSFQSEKTGKAIVMTHCVCRKRGMGQFQST